MSKGETRGAKAAARYEAVVLVSWRSGESEITRLPGDDVSDAPARVLREFVAIGAVRGPDAEEAERDD